MSLDAAIEASVAAALDRVLARHFPHDPDSAPESADVAYSPKDAARKIGISYRHLLDLIASGRIEARQLGSRVLVERSELESFVKSLPVKEAAS